MIMTNITQYSIISFGKQFYCFTGGIFMQKTASLFQKGKKIFTTFYHILPYLLLFEFIYKSLSLFIFVPIGKELITMMMDINGDTVLFNYSILKLILSLPGIAAIILIFLCSTLLIYLEFSILIIRIYKEYTKTYTNFQDTLRDALMSFSCLTNKGMLGFFVYAVLLLPFMHIGFINSLIPTVHIPYFVTGELLRRSYGSILLNSISILLFLLYCLLLFVLPIMVLKQNRFLSSCKCSIQLWKKMKLPFALFLFGLIFVWAVLFFSGIIPTDFSTLMEENLLKTICTIFFSPSALVKLLLALVVWGIQTILMLLFLCILISTLLSLDPSLSFDTMFPSSIHQAFEKTQTNIYNIGIRVYNYFSPLFPKIVKLKKKLLLLSPILVAVILVLMYLYAQKPPAIHKPISIGHRCSDLGVENTLDSLQGAIDSGADYAEIDIQLTSEGIPVIHHDANLQRLAGTTQAVSDLSLAELKQLELRQGKMTGSIATLQEMMNYCGNHIKLLIELKASSGQKEALVDTVLETIQQNKFANQCILMSLDYELVELVRKKNPDLNVGYCLFGNLGSIDVQALIELNVDFLVIEEGVVTSDFIANCKRAWLPVYVWTVDDLNKMNKYLEMGINGIISNKPYLTKEALAPYTQGHDSDSYYFE